MTDPGYIPPADFTAGGWTEHDTEVMSEFVDWHDEPQPGCAVCAHKRDHPDNARHGTTGGRFVIDPTGRTRGPAGGTP